MKELIDPYLAGEISARRVCILCYYAAKAGIQEANPYALAPTSPSGHFQRKLDQALHLGTEDEQLYIMDVPMTVRGSKREQVATGTLPPHESLYREVAEHPEILSTWSEKIANNKWVDCFESHPVVLATPKKDRGSILPLALYMDASAYQTRDSILILTIRFLHSSFRHVAFVVRKNDFCDCGCGGWCTLHCLYLQVKWSLHALMCGFFPSCRHDASEWNASDSHRAVKGGSPFGFKAIVLDIAGDWSEICHRWGA